MNELHTPAGYVKYPRDPKFRPADEVTRFEQTVKRSLVVMRVLPFVILLCLPTWTFTWAVFWAKVTIGTGAFVWLSSQLMRIFRVQGWSRWMAVLLAFVPCAIGVSSAFMSGPAPSLVMTGMFSMLAVQFFLSSLLSKELRRVGLDPKKRYCLTSKGKVDEVVAGLRMRERQDAAAVPEIESVQAYG